MCCQDSRAASGADDVAGVAGVDYSDYSGGRRSSARSRRGAAARFQANGTYTRQLLGSMTSTCSALTLDHRSDNADNRGGRSSRAPAGDGYGA